MVDEIDEYVASVNRRRQEVLPQTEIDFMHECEKNNDYDNQRYQDDVQILNINFVDRKQPSKLYHLKDIGGTAVYNAFQGDNEFVITGKLKDWHFRDQLHKIKVPTLLTFGENETMPISTGLQLIGVPLVGVLIFGEWASTQAKLFGFLGILALIIGVLLIYLVYYLQKPYIYSSVDPISEINPLILVNSENAFPDNVNLN